MSVVRMNITIPEDLAHQVDKLVGPKKRSQFISEALTEDCKDSARETSRILEEGYKARKKESQSITREFESIDLEGWDEY